MNASKCPICNDATQFLDVVDFNKSCEENRGHFLPLAEIPIAYTHCPACAFTFAPEIYQWSDAEFQEKIYNEQYIEVDPDYLTTRPKNNFQTILQSFGAHKKNFIHLDYGGGNGALSTLLSNDGWNSKSYDPFPENSVCLSSLGKFNFITAFEVFEHVPNVHRLMKDIVALMSDSCLVFFSTLLSDGLIRQNESLSWWYAAPRNGHISLYSRRSLILLAEKYNLLFGSVGDGHHYFTNDPRLTLAKKP